MSEEQQRLERIVHEAHQFVSLIRAMASGDEEVDMWLEFQGRLRLPVGVTKAAPSATSDLVGAEYMAAVLIAKRLAHRVAMLEGASVIEVLDEAERRVADAARHTENE